MRFRGRTSVAVALFAWISCTAFPTQDAAAAAEEQTGFFLLLAEAPDTTALPRPSEGEQILLYESVPSDEGQREPRRYLLIAKRPDVPLTLAEAPKKLTGDAGRTELLLELTEDGAKRLAEVTRANVGREVAFLIDGRVVSTHKIREPISGGQFKLSRCTDNACEVIYSRLAGRSHR